VHAPERPSALHSLRGSDRDAAASIAETILGGFNKHYRLFREISARAKGFFEAADWSQAREAARARIKMYDERVAECVEKVLERYPCAAGEALWPQIKVAYIALLYSHRQPELAETFFNSVACRVLHRRYFRNEFIFWRPAVATEHIEGDAPTYRCHYPGRDRLGATLQAILTGFGLANSFEDLRRDVRTLLRAIRSRFPASEPLHPNFQLQVLRSLFFRNKAAYVIGRAINGHAEYPFVIPLLQNARGELYVDALVMEPEHIGVLFSFAHTYFMVDMEVPSAYVEFLHALLPKKPKAEIYTMLGLQKHGKTVFYRDLAHHLKHSTDRFVTAPGVRGMVMLVFTLPSYPYVFKLIRDYFDPPKELDRSTVESKYLLVKFHDRVGRLADTLEYSNVVLPLERFEPELLADLQRYAASSVQIEEGNVVIGHLYIERRMIPLDMYLEKADDEQMRHAIDEYGRAIKDLAGADIFPGDLLLKNFGVTRNRRVVFYDYDEICYLTQCRFRRFPTPHSFEEEMSAEPWYTVEPNDIFPEQFVTFLFPPGRARELFLEHHGDLADAAYWCKRQERIRAGILEDVFPYPQTIRFHRADPAPAKR
jgi:isocitrate dehydrogenase kinase/phosphatase